MIAPLLTFALQAATYQAGIPTHNYNSRKKKEKTKTKTKTGSETDAQHYITLEHSCTLSQCLSLVYVV